MNPFTKVQHSDETISEMERSCKEKYPNPNYQPLHAWIPALNDIVEYNAMASNKEHEAEYLKEKGWEFIGYGFQVYTYLAGESWDNPDDLAVGQDSRLCAMFRRIK